MGSIPAWAGKPLARHRTVGSIGVYPRVGGETVVLLAFCSPWLGLSPRGRGNLRVGPSVTPRNGSIPAWAGKPRSAATRWTDPRVYPRVGGETRGNGSADVAVLGLSPRGRGNRANTPRSACPIGSILAWAGKPQSRRRPCLPLAVYPRVGGETDEAALKRPHGEGLSPRGRGNPGQAAQSGARVRSIPAWAGKPRNGSCRSRSLQVYPRVGGETFGMALARDGAQGLSPRGRGNRSTTCGRRRWVGSIPAWAGKPT